MRGVVHVRTRTNQPSPNPHKKAGATSKIEVRDLVKKMRLLLRVPELCGGTEGANSFGLGRSPEKKGGTESAADVIRSRIGEFRAMYGDRLRLIGTIYSER